MLSVVIPAFNEEAQLGDCLESLTRQDTDERFEVIVVDNNSTDRTRQVAEQYRGRLLIRVIHEPIAGRGQARFTGFRAATGDVIFSTDADTVAPPQWITTFFGVLKNSQAVAVSGPARLKDGTRLTRLIFNWLQPLCARGYRLLFGHYWLPGFSFAIWREVYFKAGEFDATMDALEDNDLSWRVKRRGSIRFVTLPVTFSGRRFFKGFWRGMGEYVVAFVKYHYLKRRWIHWTNIR